MKSFNISLFNSGSFINQQSYIKAYSTINLITSIIKNSLEYNQFSKYEQYLKEPLVYCFHIFNKWVNNGDKMRLKFIFYLYLSLIKREDNQFNEIISKLLDLMNNLAKYAADEVIIFCD